MLTRTITAIAALAVFVPILIWGGYWGVAAAFAVIAGFSVYEMLGCCGLKKNFLVSIPMILISMVSVFVPVIFEYRLFATSSTLLAMITVSLVFLMFYAVIKHKTVDVERLMMCFAMVVYITAGFTSLSLLNRFYGIWTVAFVLCVSWFTDTFAYFSGMFFGKKKLCPDISPKKTVAGAIGGTLFGTLAGVAVFVIAGTDNPILGLCALPFSLVSQLGDLAASVIKRRFGVKDYGKIFPGHGGVLDRFDSIIPVSILSGMLFMGYWVWVHVISYYF